MGRQPIPAELHERRGNPGKRKQPEPAVILPSAVQNVPETPADLGEDGQRYWGDVWRAASTWLSPEMNGAQVEGVCRRYDEIARYRRALAGGPLIKEPIVSPSGKVVGERFVPNPAEGMLRRAEKAQLADLVSLGIPPTARAKLGLVQVQAQGALERMLRERSAQIPESVTDVEAEEEW